MKGAKRSLTHVGGAARERGDPGEARALAEALDVPSSLDAEDLARAHVHGFHAYPARMHPIVARRLVERLSAPGERVLDPFCGSGTVLVEARLAGREAWGGDLNPLAVRLARLKVEGRDETARAALVEAAVRVAAVSDTRRKARAGPSRRYGAADLDLFERHVLLALDGLRVGIEAEPNERVRSDLELVLSSLLVKLSRRASDTSESSEPRGLSQRLPARLFVRKTEELARRLGEVATVLAAAPPARVMERDARAPMVTESAALVLTSPPYPGVYDYLRHHDVRLRWLGLDAARLSADEIGPRRASRDSGAAARAFEAATEDVLRAIAAALREGGSAVLVAGDGAFGGAPLRFDDLLLRVAPRAGLEPVAAASQARPAPLGAAPRFEHAVLLRRRGAKKG